MNLMRPAEPTKPAMEIQQQHQGQQQMMMHQWMMHQMQMMQQMQSMSGRGHAHIPIQMMDGPHGLGGLDGLRMMGAERAGIPDARGAQTMHGGRALQGALPDGARLALQGGMKIVANGERPIPGVVVENLAIEDGRANQVAIPEAAAHDMPEVL